MDIPSRWNLHNLNQLSRRTKIHSQGGLKINPDLEDNQKQEDKSAISRRKFLKAAGLGAAGLGAASMASGLDITSKGNPLTFNNGFKVDSTGQVDVDQVVANSIEAEQVNNVRYASQYPGSKGGEKIQNALDDLGTTPGTVVVEGKGPDDSSGVTGLSRSGIWKANNPLDIPSDTTLLLLNCFIAREDDNDDSQDANILRNKQYNKSERDENISVIGVGRPVLYGNGGQMARMDPDEGPKPEYTGLRFYEVDGLRIEGVKVRDTAGWGIKPEDVTELHVSNIIFDQENSRNQDGVHIVGPCFDFYIGDIEGRTEDDAIALSTENDSIAVEGSDQDIGNITGGVIENIRVEAYAGGKSDVKFVVGDDGVIDGIGINNIVIKSANGIHFADDVVAEGANSRASCRNISISNLTVRGKTIDQETNAKKVLDFNAPARNVHVDGVDIGGPIQHVASFRNGTQSNISISGVTGRIDTLDLVEVRDGITVEDLKLHDWQLEYYDGGFGFDRKGIEVASNGELKNCLLENIKLTGTISEALGISGTATGVIRNFQASDASTVYNGKGSLKFEGHSPPHDSAAPAVKGSQVVATSSWDPDGDGNAEKVMYDGGSWQEIVDLPNW